MKARWILRYPSLELPIVGQAIVARWWPGRYYFVSTIQIDSSSPLSQLTQSIQQGVSYGKAVPTPDKYVTQVFKCDKDGFVRSSQNSLYEREYSEVQVAHTGHETILRLLEQGNLKI
jgi:hypothetical protein